MISKIKEKIQQNKYKIFAGISFAAAAYLFYCYLNDDKNIKLSKFFEVLEKKQLDQVVISGQQIWFRSFTSDWYHSSIGNFPVSELFRILKQNGQVTFSAESQSVWPYLTIPVAIPSLAYIYMFKNMNSGVGENIHHQLKQTNTKQKFQHYHGGQRIKQFLQQTLDFIKQPQKYQKIGIRLRRGIILYGPPGTGKTMLARIIANQSKMPFIASSGSQFQQVFVGVGPKRIRSIFKTARQQKNGCLIFIDELDAVGSRNQSWQTKEQRSTINQLLCQIDGFQQNKNIFIIAATNNLAAVDPALLRPGRFDLKVMIPLPSQKDRIGIIQTLLLKKKVIHDLQQNDILKISEMTQEWTGAHLENLINQGLYRAVRNSEQSLKAQRVFEALQQILNK